MDDEQMWTTFPCCHLYLSCVMNEAKSPEPSTPLQYSKLQDENTAIHQTAQSSYRHSIISRYRSACLCLSEKTCSCPIPLCPFTRAKHAASAAAYPPPQPMAHSPRPTAAL